MLSIPPLPSKIPPRLSVLSQEQLFKVQEALSENRGTTYAARMIQQEFKLLLDMKESSLGRTLMRWRDEVLVIPKALQAAVKEDHILKKKLAVIAEAQMDVVTELEQLTRIQLERIKELREKEKQLKMPFNWVSKEMEVASTLLDKVLKAQFDTGVLEYRGPVRGGFGVKVDTPDGTTVQVGLGLNEAFHDAHKALESVNSPVVDVLARVLKDVDPSTEQGA